MPPRLAVATLLLAPLLAPLLTLPVAAAAQPPVLVTGTIAAADGRPPRAAHARLVGGSGRETIAFAPADSAGRFTLATPHAGPYLLVLSALDHEAEMVPLLLDGAGTELDARLRRHRYAPTLDSLRAIGDFNGWRRREAVPLARGADGRYRAEVPATADTVSYQLLGLADDARPVNGGAAFAHHPDASGSYRSVVLARAGRASIVLDTAARARDSTPAAVRFRDTTTIVARIATLLREQEALERAWRGDARAAAAEGRPRPDRAADARALAARLAVERDPTIRQALLLSALALPWSGGGPLDSALTRAARAEVPASSPLWSFPSFNAQGLPLTMVVGSAGESAIEALTADSAARSWLLDYARAAGSHPHAGHRAGMAFLTFFVTRLGGDAQRAAIAYDRLVRDHQGYGVTMEAESMMAAESRLRTGAPMPEFTFAALDGGPPVTRASLLGTTYLLDLWATWCVGCLEALPALHAVHDALADRGLVVVSVSLDESPDVVTRFRNGRWPMPWRHAHAPGMLGDASVRALGVGYVPFKVLVGADGTILAAGVELSGDRLGATLERLLPATPAGGAPGRR